MPTSAAAQSTCTLSTTTLTCQNGTTVVASGTLTGPATVTAVPNAGLQATGTGANVVTLTPGTAPNNTVSSADALGNYVTTSGTLQVEAAGVNFASSAGDGLRLEGTSITGTTGAADLGNLSTTAAGANALELRSAGTINVAAGTLTTAAGSGPALFADGLGGAGPITISTGAITANGTGAAARITNTTGPVTLTTGAITNSAAGNQGINIDGEPGAIVGPVSITATGPITTAGANLAEGVLLNSRSDQTINVGNVTTTGTGVFNAAIEVGRQAPGATVITAGNLSTAGSESEGIYADMTGGTISVTTGTITTTGANSEGLEIAAGSPTAVTIQTGNVSTSGVGSQAYDIVAQGTPGTIRFNNAAGTTLSTTGAGTDAVVLLANGSVTGTLGNVSATGAGSRGVVITSTASPIGLTTTGNALTIGNVTANGDAVVLNGLGGNVALGTVTSTAGRGIVVNSTTTAPFVLNTGLVTAVDDAVMIMSGGPVTATVAGVTLTGNPANAPAVNINTPGTVTFTNTGTITTGTGTTSPGVWIGNMTPIAGGTIACGNVTTGGAASPACDVTSNGALTVTGGTITTTGAGSDGINIVNASGTTTVTGGTTTVSGANSIGIDVATTGTGAVTVNTGVVNSTATNAAAVPSFAAVRVVAAGAAPVVVNATGNITAAAGSGIWAQTAGTSTVNINSGVTVSAPTAVTLGGTTGNVLVVNGTLTSTTAGMGGYMLAPGAGPLTLTIGAAGAISGPLTFTAGADAFTNNRTAGYTQSGVLDFGLGNDTFTNTTTFTQTGNILLGDGNDAVVNSGVFNMVGTTDFGIGADSFTNQAGGTVNVTGAATLLGLEALTNAGTFNQNFGLTFDATNNVVTNTGVFNATGTTDFGAGTDVFNNGTTGTTGVAGTLNAFSGATFNNLETFNNNAGIIDLRDGAAGDVFTLTNSNYVATGNARLGVDVVGTGTALTSDRLVIGGTTTGTTTVLANVINPVFDATGTVIVDSTAGNIAAGQFVLGGTTNAGFVNFGLDTRGGDVFLVARPDEALFDTLFVNRIGNDIWYQSAEAYQAYAMSRRVDYGNPRKSPVGIWAQLYGSKERFGDRNRQVTAFGTTLATSNRFETKRRGAQTGLDFGVSNFLVGVTAGYEHAEGGSDFGTDIDAEGYNYGAYAQFGAQQGLYAGILLKRDTYDLRIVNMSTGAGRIDPEGKSTGIDGEVGFRFGNPGGLNFDVGAGLSYVRTSIDDYAFGNVIFDNERFTSTRGRLQARATFAGAIAPFIDGKLFHEFGDANDILVRSGTASSRIVDEKRGTWGRIEAGLGGGAGGGPLLSAFVDLGDVRGWGIRGGFRF